MFSQFNMNEKGEKLVSFCKKNYWNLKKQTNKHLWCFLELSSLLFPKILRVPSLYRMKPKTQIDIFQTVFIFHLALIPLLLLATSKLGTFSVPILIPCLLHLLLVRDNEIKLPLTLNQNSSCTVIIIFFNDNKSPLFCGGSALVLGVALVLLKITIMAQLYFLRQESLYWLVIADVLDLPTETDSI